MLIMRTYKRIKQYLLLASCLAAGAAAITGCSSQSAGQAVTSQVPSSGNETESDGESRLITGKDTSVEYSGSGISVDGTFVTITEAGTYELAGSLKDGRISVNVGKNDSVTLILNNFQISSSETAPICGEKGKEITLRLKEGTDNQITAGSGLTGQETDEPDAAVYAGCDLIVNGTGSLSIQSEKQYGIRSKGNLTVTSGNISIVSDSGGMKAKNILTVEEGTFTINSTGDAFHSKQDMVIEDGAFTISTEDDAFHADGHLTVNGGSIQILASYEGLEGGTVTINGGTVDLASTDDGINAASDTTDDIFIRITGGSIHVNAEGDGLDSNGDLYMDGGILYVDGPVNGGDGALDFDGKGTITGGTVLAAGNARMMQAFGDQSSQPVIVMYYEETQTAGTEITLSGADGTALLTYAPSKEFSAVVISTRDLADGASYTLTTGENKEEFTLSGIVNQLGTKTAGTDMHRGGMPQGEKGERGGKGSFPPQDREMPDGGRPGRPGEGKEPSLDPFPEPEESTGA